MEFALWSLIVGLLLVLMALGSTVLKRLPLSTAMLYLLVGIGVSPLAVDLLQLRPRPDAHLLERFAEVVVLLSLFTAGLKLSPGLRDRRWALPVRLALNSMVVTIALIAVVAWLFLGLPAGACILLGAILAPTDPVLASEVQLHEAGDRDRLRFALTGEGGLNDGTAFPFVMLGLGLLGLHELGPFGLRWLAVDVVWATAGGLAIGWALGTAIGMLVRAHRRGRHRHRHRRAAVGGAVGCGILVVRAAAAAWGPAAGRADRPGPGVGVAQPALADRMVRHPRRGFAVLPHVCGESRAGARARRPADLVDGVGGGRIHRRARDFGDTSHGCLRARRRPQPAQPLNLPLSYTAAVRALTAPFACFPRVGGSRKDAP